MTYRKVVAGLMAALMLAVWPGLALAQTYFWVGVEDETGRPYTEEGVIRCSVYEPNAGSAAIVYLGNEATPGTTTVSKANSHAGQLVSDVNGRVHFYSTRDAGARYQIKCFSQYGGAGFLNDLTRATHRLIVPQNNIQKVSRFPFSTASQPTAGSGGLTSIWLPQGALITGVMVEKTGHPGANDVHLSVGFAGEHAVSRDNSLVSNMALNPMPIGYMQNVHNTVRGTILNAPLIAGASHIGLALRHAYDGGNVQSTAVSTTLSFRPYLIHVASGLNVTYTACGEGALCPGGNDVYGGHVYILWQQLHMGINRQGNQVRQ